MKSNRMSKKKGWWLAAVFIGSIAFLLVEDKQKAAFWVQAIKTDGTWLNGGKQNKNRIRRTAIRYGESPPLSTIPSADPIPFNSIRFGEDDEEPGPLITPLNFTGDLDGALQLDYPVGASSAISTVTTFEGISNQDVVNAVGGGFVPPDSCIAVGDDQVVEMVDSAFQVYNKQGEPQLAAPMALANIWAGTANCQTNDGHPISLWDKVSKRWVLMQFAITGGSPYELCFAVSTTANATGTYILYELSTGNVFPDSPKMSLWRDKLVVTTVDFIGNSFRGVSVHALNWNQMISGTVAIDSMSFPLLFSVHSNKIQTGLLAADVDGYNQPDEDAPIPLFGINDNAYGGSDGINIWELSIDWSNMNTASLLYVQLLPTSSFDSILNCTGTPARECIPQLEVTRKLDFGQTTTARLMNRVAYRSFIPPTASPSESPSNSPSDFPSEASNGSPSTAPSDFPSAAPSQGPSMSPIGSPSTSPSKHPSMSPSESPSTSPSEPPSEPPSLFPSDSPSTSPSESPRRFPNLPNLMPGLVACAASPLSWRECLQELREPTRFEDSNAVHHMQVGYESMVMNSGVEAFAGIAGVRWYEVRRVNGAYTIHQQGTYAPNDNVSRFYGSIAQDKLGNIGLGYSVSGTGLFPGIRVTGRSYNAGTLGEMDLGEAVFFAGEGSQVSSNRWGDYTSMMVDPVDDCTFWYANQFPPSASTPTWRTRVGYFFLDDCDSSLGTSELDRNGDHAY